MSPRKIIAAVFVLPLALGLAACKEKEGPAEKAGKEIDKAASSLGEQIESVGQQIQNSVTSAN
ncbi:hypothetical protein VRY85_13270 [Achromobacter sp. F4_2707]|uniref:hypothetical protein n=1 Tax=Achromobacter sp. F4_2707 TaxID=3114286 RepID=UPI0039C66F13